MSDLISRKKLKEVIEPMVGIFEDDGSFWWSRESILGAIDSDFVEADEPKVGKWEECKVVDIEDTTITEIQSAYCPICHKYHTTPYMYYFDYFNYCPNCGAKMERSER